MANDITEAILAEAKAEIDKPYSTSRKIKGWMSNKYRGTKRTALGGSTDAKSRAKQLGRHAVAGAPMLLAQAAKKIPVVGSAAKVITKVAAEKVAGKVADRIDKDRKLKLRAKQYKGSLTVQEMTELMQKEGDKAVSKDTIGKMHDAVRKVDEAYTGAVSAIQGAKDCESIYKAAKKYYYLNYRVVRLNFYLEKIRQHIEEIQDIADRYSSHVIGYQFDLADAMDGFFSKTGPEYHQANCKNTKHCYFKLHGLA